GAAPSACGTNDGSAVFFAYTATTTGMVEARTCGAAFDTTLAVAADCVSPPLDCNNNACGIGSKVRWSAQEGVTYLLRLAGNNNATGSVNLTIDDPAHTDLTMPLAFNWNGICHGPSEQTLPDPATQNATTGTTHENRSDVAGFRSIADRGLLCDGVNATALNFGGTVGFEGITYNVYSTAGQSDMIHLGNRNLAAGGLRAWAANSTLWTGQGGTATTNNGVRPIWLNNDDQTTPQTSLMNSLGAVFGPATKVAFLYHMSNVDTFNGAPRPAFFDVTLGFSDGSSFTASVQATDWFGTNTQVLPGPATDSGIEVQRVLGTYRGVQNTDRASDAPTGSLKVMEAIVSTAAMQAAGFDAAGKTLSTVSFGNLRSGNAAQDSIYSAVGIYAATLRDPATFNLNFGPAGIGTASPSQVPVGSVSRLAVAVARGSGSPNQVTNVVVDGSSIGLAADLQLNDSGQNGDLAANDNIWSRTVGFPINATPGGAVLPFIITDGQDRTGAGNIVFSVIGVGGSVTPAPARTGEMATVTVPLARNTGGANDIVAVTVDASSVGAGTLMLNDLGQNGDTTSGDGIWSSAFLIPEGVNGGTFFLSLMVTDASARTANGQIGLAVIGPPASTDLGTLAEGLSAGMVEVSGGSVQWLKFTLNQDIVAGGSVYLDIDTEGSTTTGNNDTYIGLFDAQGLRIQFDDDDGSGFQSQLTFGATSPPRPAFGNGVAYNGRDGGLAAGTYYLALTLFPATVNATEWSVTSTSANSGTILARLLLANVPGGGVPTEFTDLGALGTDAQANTTVAIAAGGVGWVRFEVTAPGVDTAARSFIDIDTEGSGIPDTVIGLFRDDGSGTLVAVDDDSGSGDLSQLTFGRGTRNQILDGLPYNGRNGATLAPGVYYLAVAEFSVSYGNNFIAFFTTGTTAGDIAVNIRRGNQPPPPPSILFGPVIREETGSTYYLFDVGLNWEDAEAGAVMLGGHLATINDDLENEFVRTAVLGFDGADRRGWIGLNDVGNEGIFGWTSGQPVNFLNWNDGEPNNANAIEHYTEMLGGSGRWNDLPLAGPAGGAFAIMEIDNTTPPCRIDFNNDGIVEPGDLDDFITYFFSDLESERAMCDFNNDGLVEPGDLDDFITAFFEGC
ncbi:MAG: DVUA0089 family protein, partial [Phycisphaerales bacterium]